jgi:hypothetical protein
MVSSSSIFPAVADQTSSGRMRKSPGVAIGRSFSAMSRECRYICDLSVLLTP